MDTKAPATQSAPTEIERLGRFMERHRFVASRQELLTQGFSGSRIKNWLRGRRLVRLFQGVYSFGRDIETRESAWRAALLIAGREGALTGCSALELWGAVKCHRGIPARIRVATPVERRGKHQGLSSALENTVVEVVRRLREPGDIRRREGLPLLSAPLALIEFAGSASRTDVTFAFLELCRLHLFGKRDVAFSFRRLTNRPGALKLKPLLTLWVPELNRIKSVLEGLFLLAWVERGWRAPQVNVKVFGREVDCFWPWAGVALELDGDAFHSDPIAKARDLEKTSFLESKGLRVIRVTWKEFMDDPSGVVDRIAREVGHI